MTISLTVIISIITNSIIVTFYCDITCKIFVTITQTDQFLFLVNNKINHASIYYGRMFVGDSQIKLTLSKRF